MLEMDVVENNDMKMQIVTTLQSTSTGKRLYAQLCDRQIALRELVCILVSIINIILTATIGAT